MKTNNGLRQKIEHRIGRQILKKVHLSRIETVGPTMIPPVPDSKFIDKLPGGVLEGPNNQEKEHQDAYEAEVKVYRRLEEMKNNYIVIHQLEFTHEHYSAFLQDHLCYTKRCKRGQNDHPCHKEPKQIEGECDFLVMGKSFIAVLEVKGLSLQYTDEDKIKLKGCCENAFLQRKRIKELIHSFHSSVRIFEFTFFPNISKDDVEEIYQKDETILFREDLESIGSKIDSYEDGSSTVSKIVMEKLRCSLLGLWCIDHEGEWNFKKCSLTYCIKEIDQKLRKALVTRKSVDEQKLAATLKSGKKRKEKAKHKKYPSNSKIVEAPQLLKDRLKINCLTQDQFDVLNCEERFVWVEGIAGSGKTITMLGKIIDIILNKPEHRGILVILPGLEKGTLIKRHFELFSDITECAVVTYNYEGVKGDTSSKVAKAQRNLTEQLQNTSSKLVLLVIFDTHVFDDDMYSIITSFDYVFVDDYQVLVEKTWLSGHILSKGLLPVVTKETKNKTSLWILCDEGQAFYSQFDKIGASNEPNLSERCKRLYGTPEFIISFWTVELKNHCSVQFFLTVNLRNTLEISALSSVIRKYGCLGIDSTGEDLLDPPEQEIGHVIRGPVPVIYLLKEYNPVKLVMMLRAEVWKLKESDFGLTNEDLAIVQHSRSNDFTFEGFAKMLEWFDITHISPLLCVSAEWPAAICVFQFASPKKSVNLSNGSTIHMNTETCIPYLYIALSRARVYSTLIIHSYRPNKCKITDNLISELRQRNDICRLVE